MRRYAILVAVVALLSMALACGGVFFGYFTFSGSVSVVQFAVIDGDDVTIVTLIGSGNNQTIHFCGNVVSQFPPDAFVTVNYRQNGGCYSLLQIVIR